MYAHTVESDNFYMCFATGLPWDNKYMDQHINDTNYRVTNSGWSDQRAYISRAVTALGSLPIRTEIEQALAASEPSAAAAETAGLSVWKLDVDGAPQGTLQCNSNGGVVSIGFDASGAISSLRAHSPVSGSIGRQWADANHTLGRFRYRSHSEGEFDHYGDRYMLPGKRLVCPMLCRSLQLPSGRAILRSFGTGLNCVDLSTGRLPRERDERWLMWIWKTRPELGASSLNA